MKIEQMLSTDFSALKERLVDDAFVRRVVGKLNGAERMRLAVVGGAGAIGAAIAASQFSALAAAFADATPALAQLYAAENFAAYDFGAAPALAAALLFALAGGATALILPGAR